MIPALILHRAIIAQDISEALRLLEAVGATPVVVRVHLGHPKEARYNTQEVLSAEEWRERNDRIAAARSFRDSQNPDE